MSGPVTPAVGETFGGYTIEAVLGRGGMGTVFLAHHERLARKVALKVIAPELAQDQDFRARFLRESQLAASLDHANVIPIYDANEVGDVLYLAMRYVNGPSLDRVMRERGPLPVAEALRPAEQIAGALDAAHEEGLVHRDVKPGNILLAESGRHAYLCDFGLAKRADSHAVTRTGFFVGTSDYAAPEQIRGGDVDGRADLYSLGCVVFHCLAGRPPFVRDSELAVLSAHLNDPPPALSSVRSNLPPALDAVLVNAMAKNPNDRYPTGAELTADLRRALDGGTTAAEPTRAAPVPPTRALPRPPRQRRWWVVAGVVAAIAVAAAVVGLLAKGTSPGGAGGPKLRTFAQRIENVLEQAASGRHEIAAALSAGLACKISPGDAAQRIGSVADNRESVLVQLGNFATPNSAADNVVTQLQKALQQSIEADRHYRDGFATVTQTTCPLPQNADFALAKRADVQATQAKRRFVAAFDPLARRFGLRTWGAGDF